MLWLPFAGARLGSQGFYTHDEHQAAGTISSQGCFWSREVVGQCEILLKRAMDAISLRYMSDISY
jgi:hypothetical protein